MDNDKIKQQNLISIGSIIVGIVAIIFILSFDNVRGGFSSITSNLGSSSGGRRTSTQDTSSSPSSSNEKEVRPQNGQLPEQQSLTSQEAVSLIKRWQSSKQQMFAPPYNRQLSRQVLTGEAYENNIGSIDWLEDNGAYYTYNLQRIEDADGFYQDGNVAHINVVVREQRTLCMNGTPSQDDNTIDDKRLVRYNLKNQGGNWKISSYETQNVIDQRGNPNKSC